MNPHITKIRGLFDELNSYRREERAYYPFCRIVDEILHEIRELISEEEDEDKKNTYVAILHALDHTRHKEIEWIKSAEDKMNKKNAAKKRSREHTDIVEASYDHVYRDLIMILVD